MESKQCLQHFFYVKFILVFSFLYLDLAALPLIAKFDHVLFVIEKHVIFITEALLSRSQSSFQFGLSYL